jgi:hypothetical protein
MPSTIEGHERPLYKIFSDDYAFEIPRYQRPYAWTNEQALVLLDDVATFLSSPVGSPDEAETYFLGCIVLIKGATPKSEVVDGQQRLTTLTILLAALANTIEDQEFADAVRRRLKERGDRLAGTADRFRLKLREKDDAFFQEHVLAPSSFAKLRSMDQSMDPVRRGLSDSQKNIRLNALAFEDRLRTRTEQDRQRLARYLDKNCFVVVVSTPDMNAAYRIFSVLNDRGLDLSLTDILKAEIMGALPEDKQDHYASIWEREEEDLGRARFEDLFAHIRMIARRTKAKGSVLQEIRDHMEPNRQPAAFIDRVGVPSSDAYEKILKSSYESAYGAEAVNRSLGWLNRTNNFDWIPPAIQAMARLGDQPDALGRFLRRLERLTSALMIMRVYVNDRIERMGRVLAELEPPAGASPGVALDLTNQERLAVLDRLDGPLYLEPREMRNYVLLRLDSMLAEEDATYDTSVLTIEHVLPQTPAEGSQWLRDFPDPDVRAEWTHRIANLVLLNHRKNPAASNKDFKDKKDTYFVKKGKSTIYALTTSVLKAPTWTVDVLEERQKWILGEVAREWDLAPAVR